MPASRRFTEVAAALAAALFLVSWGLLHTGWYDENEIVDIPVYESYGNAIESGAVPYRDIRPEYPPGALPAFAVPAASFFIAGAKPFACTVSQLSPAVTPVGSCHSRTVGRPESPEFFQ